MNPENNENKEIIDNEKINIEWIDRYLDSFEWKSKDFIKERWKIIDLLNQIDNLNKDIDIDMQYDKNTKLYYIVKNEKIINQPLTWEEFINKFSGSPESLTNINE